MKRLAMALSAMLVLGILSVGVLGKNDKDKNDRGNTQSTQGSGLPANSNGNGWGKGGNPNKPAGTQTESSVEANENGDEAQEGDDGEGGGEEDDGEEPEDDDGEEEQNEDDDDGAPVKPTPKYPADSNGLHKTAGKVRHLYLYQKDPETWQPVAGGAWGKMTYTPAGRTFRYDFTGHGLQAGQEYCLLYYPDPWPGEGLICLGSGTANGGGNIHMSDRLSICDLPLDTDQNEGAKIWLVLASDVDCDVDGGTRMIGWHPTEYLFEYDLISYDGPCEPQSNGESSEDSNEESEEG